MLVRWAGPYEFQAATHGGWFVYLNDFETGAEPRQLGWWDSLEAAHFIVGAPPFDEEE